MYEQFIETIKQENFRGFNSLEYSDGGQELYVSFKTILRFTAENLNLFGGIQGSSGDEIIKIDWKLDKPMFMFSTSISCNLKKCYIRNSLLQTSPGTLSTLPLIFSWEYIDKNAAGDAAALSPPFYDVGYFVEKELADLRDSMVVPTSINTTSPGIYPSIGNINNIYFNASFLTEVLIKESDNEDGKVSIRKYLQKLCNSANKALGGINDLQVIIDEDASTPSLTIIDFQQKRIKGLSRLAAKDKAGKEKPVTVIKGQGLGSMLTNISAQSSITPDIASMISIGAQAQGYALGQEAVSFSRLSEGLLDKIYPQKFITREDVEKQNKKVEEREAKAKEKFQSVMNTYANLITKQQPENDIYGPISLTADDQADYENVATDFYKYLLAKFTETGQTATSFIPVKLSFNMRGIGGMKIYQKFRLTDDILPLSYSSDYEFIIMGISHTVDNSKWDTTVSATISLIDPPVRELEKFSIPLEVREFSTSSSLSAGNVKPLTNAKRISNVQKIARYLKSIKLTKEGATGLIGNILGESQANEKAAERDQAIGGLGGIGIVQWTAVRRRDLEKAANDDNTKVLDLDFQLDYLGNELKGSYSRVLAILTTTTSIEDATVVVLEKFEVPLTYLLRDSNPTAYQETKEKRFGYALSVEGIVADIYNEVT